MVTYELIYSWKDIKTKSLEIIEKRKLTQKEKTKVIEILNKVDPSFNFRDLDSLITFVKHNFEKSEKLFFNSRDVDEDVKSLFKAIGSVAGVEKQMNLFCKERGAHRATFYRLKRQFGLSRNYVAMSQVSNIYGGNENGK